MTSIFVRDKLRASVEASTGGMCTVLYSQAGAPSHFFILPRFNLEDIDPGLGSGPHPAFIVDRRVLPKIFIGQYQGYVDVPNLQIVSLPGLRPTPVSSNGMSSWGGEFAARGAGYHLMTNTEWSAVTLWCLKNGFAPHGNTRNGAYEGTQERGIVPTVISSATRYAILAGSGPASWRHNNSAAGISDLVGNLWEWVGGLRLFSGEIQVCENNDAASADWQFAHPDYRPWKAIDFATGSLVPPGTAGTVKVDSLAAANPGNPGGFSSGFAYSAAISNSLASTGEYNMSKFEDTDAGPTALKMLCLSGFEGLPGRVWMRNWGTQYALRGAGFESGTNGSLFSLAIGGNESTILTGCMRIAKY